jgi:acyl transferase domain-containing protein/acyl carrier protein
MSTDVLLQRALDEIVKQRAELADLRAQRASPEPIAVVGVGCRFPGDADTPTAFWSVLDEARDGTREVPADRWPLPARDASGTPTVRRGGFLSRIDTFDAEFFGISPREARIMDPQQRLLLETAWHALEHAGIAPPSLYDTSTGVYVGVTCFDHAIRVSGQMPTLGPYAGTGSALNMIPGRLAFLLGLRGPAMAVDTACSSALVALHLACQGLRAGECDTALAGGVQLMLSPDVMTSFAQAHMLSPDGWCKTFDARADGYARGEGCGVAVLRRLGDAEAAGDRILGVIRGSAVNQDGPSGGLTVPSGRAQAAVIMRALEQAGVSPHDVDYVEAHGTGTALGDPIEIEALASTYGKDRRRDDPLLVGSVKTNIGHLEPAAGMASLTKVLLAFAHGRIPAHRHVTRPNPHIAWNDLAVEIVTSARAWPPRNRPVRAGLSAFGFSGTNAHVIVEAPKARTHDVETPVAAALPELLCLSARSAETLRRLASSWVTCLSALSAHDWSAACWTTRAGRAHFAHRLALVADSPEAARAQLQQWLAGRSAVIPNAVVVHGVSTTAAYAPEVVRATQLAGALLAQGTVSDAETLRALAGVYVEGADIDWRDASWARPATAVDVPFYPFARQRHWLELPGDGTRPTVGSPEPAAYRVAWETAAPATALMPEARPLVGRELVIVGDDGPLVAALVAQAARLGGVGRHIPSISDGDTALGGGTDLLLLPDAGSDLEPPDGGSLNGDRVVALLHAAHAVLAETERQVPCWVITRGVAPVDRAAPGRLAMSEAARAAAARVLGLEHPEYAGRIIDLDADRAQPQEDAAAILAELVRGRSDDMVAVRGAARWVPRVQPHHDVPPLDRAPMLRDDRTYLITGGLGVIGVHVAETLARAGARRLLLLNRRGTMTPEIADRLTTLSAQGVRVESVAADVADAEALRAALRAHVDPAFPLAGVFHAAGVGGVEMVTTLDEAAVREVLRPKLRGAWTLHAATRDVPLDHFVLFSSIAGVWGSRGQLHYAAANAALDALAQYRRDHGLPAVAVNWGPWAESGMTDADAAVLLRRVGVHPLVPAVATDWLRRCMAHGEPQVLVASIEWPRFRGSYEARGPRGLFAALPHDLQLSAAHHEEPSAAPWVQTIRQALPLERERLVRDVVTAGLRQILGWEDGRPIPPDQGLFELGVDSLAALELRTHLERLLGQSLPATLVFQYPTVTALTAFVGTVVLPHATEATDAPAPRPATPSSRPAAAAPSLDTLSDDEAEAMLRRTLDALDLPT